MLEYVQVAILLVPVYHRLLLLRMNFVNVLVLDFVIVQLVNVHVLMDLVVEHAKELYVQMIVVVTVDA
jgi:hypothetical protein